MKSGEQIQALHHNSALLLWMDWWVVEEGSGKEARNGITRCRVPSLVLHTQWDYKTPPYH